MCRALGLNTVCVYLFWNFHEWEEGRFDWSGQADAAEFCRLAQEAGLWVLLRPGPYSCAEWEMGGLPWWLTKREGIRVRSTDPAFLEPAIRYLREVGRVLAPLQVSRGGPILMAQVENEYGSFGSDPEYMGALRQAMIDGGFEVPLFACDPPGDLANGHRNDLFKVVNFGTGAAQSGFDRLRALQGSGPLMNGEYYPAWFDMWGRRHRTGRPEPIVEDLDYMLENRRSFSIYMAHGGTSFGLWAGADRPFSPDTTSYDYDAPISESGWATPKFAAIRALMERYSGFVGSLPEPPKPNPVIEVPEFTLSEFAPIFENLPRPILSSLAQTMESYDQSRGMTLYRTYLSPGPAETLTVGAVHDFAWAFLDGEPVGAMDRRSKKFSLNLPAREQMVQLDLLVYAMGRVNFGPEVLDCKGIHGPVCLGHSELTGWDVYPFSLDGSDLETLKYGPPAEAPGFWRGDFSLTTIGDFFLDTRSWGKGVIWINGHSLGRFWNIGPAQTLYVPAPWLKVGINEIVVLDLLGPEAPKLQGLSMPILDELRLELDFVRRERASGQFVANRPVASGAFPSDADWQTVRFEEAASGRFLCLEALSAFDNGYGASVAELDALELSGKPISKAQWKIVWVSSEETNYVPGDAENAIDGQNATSWHTERGATGPHQIVIDLGSIHEVGGIRYLPTAPGPSGGDRIQQYRIYVSEQPFGLSSSA